jgi:hypothetical protein
MQLLVARPGEMKITYIRFLAKPPFISKLWTLPSAAQVRDGSASELLHKTPTEVQVALKTGVEKIPELHKKS